MSKLPVTENQFRNILAFAMLMVGDKDMPDLVDRSPAYIVEKFTTYIAPAGLTVYKEDCWLFGLHPLYSHVIVAYMAKWNPEFTPTKEE